MNNKISILSRVLLFTSSVLLIISIFIPIWRIELDAPQYPEGLVLEIFSNKLGGDAEIINGLNHYIGMKTLHAENFIEFSILTYIIGFYALFALVAAVVAQKKVAYVLLTLFVLFGVIAMIDFWRWEYDYGHDLDPHAAIIVPGMAYQPPLIGFKQLLNFGAYSVPDTGGWLFIISGLLMLVVTMNESQFFKRFSKNKKNVISSSVILLLSLFFSSCANTEAQPIIFNHDNCDNCKMSIADNRFGCELVTDKGRVYKFDDLSCLLDYKIENADKNLNATYYVCDYIHPNTLISLEKCSILKSESISSPMGGGMASFSNADSAKLYQSKWNAELISWQKLN